MASIPEWPGGGTRRRFDMSVVIPVLIGVVSVTVALLAWRATQLDELATDQDRLALADEAFVRLAGLEAELFASNLETADVRLQLALAEARALRDAAAASSPDAAALVARAEELEVEAAQLVLLSTRRADDEALQREFDVDQAVEAILAGNRELGRHDPGTAVEEADSLRDRSLRFAGLTVAMAFAVVLLTGAQVSRRASLRLPLAATAVVVWAGAALVAAGSWS